MTTEAEFIRQALAEEQEKLTQIPIQFRAAQRATDREIDALCEEAGILDKVQTLRERMENAQKALQTQADLASGKTQVLKTLLETYHLAPLPPGVTHMYGIDLRPLEWQTRLNIMSSTDGTDWEQAVRALGGDPERRDWDGTEETVDEAIIEEEPALPPNGPTTINDLYELEGLLHNEGDLDPTPEETVLAEIEEIENRIEEGSATDEDLVRVRTLMVAAQEANP